MFGQEITNALSDGLHARGKPWLEIIDELMCIISEVRNRDLDVHRKALFKVSSGMPPGRGNWQWFKRSRQI